MGIIGEKDRSEVDTKVFLTQSIEKGMNVEDMMRQILKRNGNRADIFGVIYIIFFG